MKNQKNQRKLFINQGKFLAKVRKSRLLKQSDLSKLLTYCSGQSISNTERGGQALPMSSWVELYNKVPFDWMELKEAMLKDHEAWIMSHYALTLEGSKPIHSTVL